MSEEKKKTFEMPALIKEEVYQTAGPDYHCHQVKSECSPYQAKA